MATLPFVLYRDSITTQKEQKAIAASGINSGVDLVSGLKEGTTVFTRFRSIPYGELLQQEVAQMGYNLVNSWAQYNYIADVHAWKNDLKGLTPDVFTEDDIPSLPEGEWFVKGETNSDKENWNSSCYAADLESLNTVVSNLHNHPVVGNQKLVIRPFIHYRKLGVMENGQPICNEWRVFVLNGQVVGVGFYWAARLNQIAVAPSSPVNNPVFIKTLNEAISRVGNKASYVVFDFAERVDGTWDVIELNDGNMSGLCDVDPVSLWQNIANSYV